MDTKAENTDEKCDVSSEACKQLELENQELRDKLQKLEEQIAGIHSGERADVSVASPKEKNGEIQETPDKMKEKKGQDLEFSPEQARRLKGDYDDVVKKNQELESRILQMASEMQTEKEKFEATVGAMSKQLMDFVEKMNKLEVEAMKYKRDCSLVVQLLKCNQSLDRKFVSQKMDTLPSELKDKLTTELDLKEERQPLSHPDWSKKLWRTKSIGPTNAKTEPQSKTVRTPKFSE